jgi:hypothetical protein
MLSWPWPTASSRYRALLLPAGFGRLRLGELLALRPMDIDIDRGIVRVNLQAVELKNGALGKDYLRDGVEILGSNFRVGP